MDYLHIIMLWFLFIALICIYLVARICTTKNLVSDDLDFFNAFILKTKNKLENNDISMKTSSYFAIMFLAPLVVGIAVYVASKNAVLTVILASASFLTPEGIILIMKQKSTKDFEDRYARSLEQLASSLRAGLSISQAVQEVANNKFIHESIRAKYRRLSSDLQMGISVSDAFQRFADHSNSQDARDVAIAIDVQNEVGGHEAETIMSIAKDIHDRIMLRREIKSLFSGTSSMVYMMDFIPIGIIVFLCLTDASYISFYFSNTVYSAILIIIVVMCLVGSYINHSKLKKILKGC